MDLAFVDILAKKYWCKHYISSLRLVDRTVDVETMKSEYSKETVRAFSTMFTKKNLLKKEWVDKGTEFAGQLQNFLMLKEYKFTTQWVRTRLHVLNVHDGHSNVKFTVTWKTMGTSILKIHSFCRNFDF